MIKLCQLEDIPNGGARGFHLPHSSLLAVRQDERVYIYKNRCPHRGIPLEWLPDQFLDNEAELIRCSSHGALFQIDTGLCVAGPCAGASLTAIPCKIDQDAVWIGG